MRRNIFRDIPGANRLNRKLHGKKAVIVFSEHLTVHEIPPAADSLPQDQPRHAGVPHQERVLLLDPAIDEQRGKCRDDTAVYGQAAVPQLEDAQQIVLVIIPREYHIINPRPYDGKNHGINGKIPIIIRILACHLRHMGRHQDARQDTDSDDQAIKGNIEPEYAERLRHILQIDSQMGERDITNIHTLIPFIHADGLTVMPRSAALLQSIRR